MHGRKKPYNFLSVHTAASMEPNLAVEGKLGRKKEFPDLIDLSGFQARKERRKKNRNNNKEERKIEQQ